MLNFLGKVFDSFTNFSPIKRFIKYALDKTFNEFLSSELKLQDFKNGELNLSMIDFNVEKINRTYLISSPYILQTGTIGNLVISLPPLSEISSKSIQISVKGLQITLKPNKQFYKTFKEALRERQESELYQTQDSFAEGEISQNGPLDFFKQLLKQIILNIRIKVESMIIKVFMNEPSTQSTKPQYYLMLRVPQIFIGQDEQIAQKNIEVEQIRFNIEVPQISAHLLRQGTDYPEYKNEKMNKNDFPFTYPTVFHPSTILLVGNTDGKSLNGSKIVFSLKTDYQNKIKETLVLPSIANIQLMVDPIQIKIFSRFLIQIQQFNHILKLVLIELGIDTSSSFRQSILIDGSVSRRSTGNSTRMDLFSSVVMSLHDLNKKRQRSSYYDSFVRESSEANQIKQFNLQCSKKLKQISETKVVESIEETFRNINFKNNFMLKFKINCLNVYVCKYMPEEVFRRRWVVEYKESKVNKKIGSAYFMVGLENISFDFNSKEKTSNMYVDSAIIYNVKLSKDQTKQLREVEKESIAEEYYRPGSQIKHLLIDFQLQKDQHYCIQEILRVSKRQPKMHMSKDVKTYSFLPREESQMQKEDILIQSGLLLKYRSVERTLTVNIEEISLSLNTEIAKDFMNILNPVLAYKKLSESFNLQSALIEMNAMPQNISTIHPHRNSPLLESQYIYVFGSNEVDHLKEFRQKQIYMNLSIELINIGLRECSTAKNFQHLSNKLTPGTREADLFDHQCFCDINKNSLYTEVFQLQFIKAKESWKASCRKIEAGIINIINSVGVTDNLCSLFRIEGQEKQDLLRVFWELNKYESNQGQAKVRNALVYVPHVKIKIQQKDIMEIIEMGRKIGNQIELLAIYRRRLMTDMVMIDRTLYPAEKTSRKCVLEKTKPIIQIFILQVELELVFISLFARQIFSFLNEDDKMLKFQVLAVGLKEKIRSKIGQMKNQVLGVTEYPASQKYKGIQDSNIILEIEGNLGRNVEFESQHRVAFFQQQLISKKTVLFQIVLNNNSQANREVAISKEGKFQFLKNANRLSLPIPEQRNCQSYNVSITNSINICAVNLLRLVQLKPKMQQIIDDIKTLQKQLIAETAMFKTQRKSFNESELQNPQMLININSVRLQIDIRPEYQHSKQREERVFSNTRLIFGLQLDNLQLKVDQDNELYSLHTAWQLQTHFLKHEDRYPEINPLLVSETDYAALGFKNIFQIRGCNLELMFDSKRKIVVLKPIIKEVNLTMSISTIQLLKLHCQHFINHNLKNNYGISLSEDDDLYEVLVDSSDSGSDSNKGFRLTEDIDDFSQGYTELQAIVQRHLDSQSNFLERDFLPFVKNSSFSIVGLVIKSIRIKLNLCPDFRFVDCNSLYESIEKKRQLASDGDDAMNYFCFYAQNLGINLQKSADQMEISLQTDKIESILSQKKKSSKGLLGWFKNTIYEQEIFSLLKCEQTLKVLIKSEENSFKIKMNRIQLGFGFTSDVIKLLNELERAKHSIAGSGWKKRYEFKGKKLQKCPCSQILVHVPTCRIYLTLEYKGVCIISNQAITSNEFMLNQNREDGEKIKQNVLNQLKSLLKNNVGNLVGGVAVNGLSAIITQIVSVISYCLRLALPGSQKKTRP